MFSKQITQVIFYRTKIEGELNGKLEFKVPSADENRELKVGSNLQLTTGNSNEISVKESSFHHGVAVPMTMEDLEKEIAREKDILNKAKKKIAMESSTPKDGISTWILLSGSNNPTKRPEMKPAFRIDSAEKKPAQNVTMTTKKRPVTTTTKLPKTTPKFNNNKLLTRVKVSSGELKNETDVEVTTKAPATTKKPQLTTKAKKYTTLRPKTTTTTTTQAPATSTEAVEIYDDDETEEQRSPSPPVETSTFLIMEAKDADFNLPNDRAPSKSTSSKKTTKVSTKTKKKKISAIGTNSTRIRKKSDKKTGLTKLSSKNPEKPISTQIYNYLAREVMPTVGVGLVGLVVTAGLATYFLGGPLTALRRSYDISNRRDDVAYDRSDDFGNVQNEEEMFGKVIAGMPENSAYRNNIRASSYRPKVQQYSGYSQYAQQSPKYGAQQQLRYRQIDPYQNSYQNQYPQYYQQHQSQIQAQSQAKSSIIDYEAQQAKETNQPQSSQNTQKFAVDTSAQKFNIDAIDMTTNAPETNYNLEYDDIAQSYFPQQEQTQTNQVTVEQQKMNEIEEQHNEIPRSEKFTIVQAQSVPSNHRTDQSEKADLPTPAALTMSHSDEEYQNSIANAIMSQKKQFVVGSVIAEHFEENPPSIVPEHGPRRRRRDAIKKAAKSLENNEIDGEEDKVKRENEATTEKSEPTTEKADPTTAKEEIHESSSIAESVSETSEESTSQYPTYNIENGQNNIFHLFRRIIDLKLRMGLNFLQNATIAFQHYLRGVEQRVNTSPLFNPYVKNETAAEGNARKSNKRKASPVEAL